MAWCTSPNYFSRHGFTACGKCFGCRLNKKKEWRDRQVIESRYHKYNYFVTLTYSPEYLPVDESVSRDEIRRWLKRLAFFAGYTPAHFGCGEYGDESARPHYHCCVFADTDIFHAILASWTKGNVDIEHFQPGRASYVAGYVVKKMTKVDDERLAGRLPEFWFSSRRPALGYKFLFDLLERMASDENFRQVMLSHVYPPSSLKIGGKSVRLPRYIRDKLKPFYRIDNYERQEEFRKEKAFSDAQILKQIAANLPGMLVGSVKWDCCKLETKKLREERERLVKKAYEIKHRRIL